MTHADGKSLLVTCLTLFCSFEITPGGSAFTLLSPNLSKPPKKKKNISTTITFDRNLKLKTLYYTYKTNKTAILILSDDTLNYCFDDGTSSVVAIGQYPRNIVGNTDPTGGHVHVCPRSKYE